MADMSTVAQWAVALLGTGGVGKFAWDLFISRGKRSKDRAEGAAILVGSAAEYARGLTTRLDQIQADFDQFRREQAERDRQQEALFRRHRRWDDEVRRVLQNLGHGTAVPEPPPLSLSDAQ